MDVKDFENNYVDDPNATEFLASSKIPIKPHNFKLEVQFFRMCMLVWNSHI